MNEYKDTVEGFTESGVMVGIDASDSVDNVADSTGCDGELGRGWDEDAGEICREGEKYEPWEVDKGIGCEDEDGGVPGCDREEVD